MKFPEESFASTYKEIIKVRDQSKKGEKQQKKEQQDSDTLQDYSKDCSEQQNCILLSFSSHVSNPNFPQTYALLTHH